jgi:hypothetical protein
VRARRPRGRDRLILVGVLLLAGLFLVRRFVMLAHQRRTISSSISSSPTRPPSEEISPAEQRALDQVIHDKARP